MASLKKSNFYYGTVLDKVTNAPGKALSLLEKAADDSGRVYRLTTESNKDGYIIFAKYRSDPASTKGKDGSCRWAFQFTDAEMGRLEELCQQTASLKLALVCAKGQTLTDSELALIDYEQALECLGKGFTNPTINVLQVPGKMLRMYGTAREEKLNGKDNCIKVDRDAASKL